MEYYVAIFCYVFDNIQRLITVRCQSLDHAFRVFSTFSLNQKLLDSELFDDWIYSGKPDKDYDADSQTEAVVNIVLLSGNCEDFLSNEIFVTNQSGNICITGYEAYDHYSVLIDHCNVLLSFDVEYLLSWSSYIQVDDTTSRSFIKMLENDSKFIHELGIYYEVATEILSKEGENK